MNRCPMQIKPACYVSVCPMILAQNRSEVQNKNNRGPGGGRSNAQPRNRAVENFPEREHLLA
jgi:hypothetical protein